MKSRPILSGFRFSLKLLALLFVFGLPGDSSQEQTETEKSPIVKLEQGELQGQILKSRNGVDYNAFWGIPYAKPPKRFQIPEPPVGWEGIRNASTPRSACLQFDIVVTQKIVGSEDCLFLNVFTTSGKDNDDKDNLKPVIVYIHGGGFMYGSGEIYGADYIMDEPVVLVTINYRLSSLGFLNIGNWNESAEVNGNDEIGKGNMGLKDQTMALRWVNENIKEFGGDPNRITIFGTSAGGASVSYHMLSPMSKGLFQNAMSSSGTALCPWALQKNPKRYAKELAAALNCPTSNSQELMECLLKKDAADIIAKSLITSVWPLDPLIPFGPSIETSPNSPQVFLSEDPEVLLEAGKFNKVPWIVGIVKNEGRLIHSMRILNDEVLTNELNQNWNSIAPVTFGYEDIIPKDKWEVSASEIHDFYFGSKNISKASTEQDLENVYSDRNFIHGIRSTILHQAKHSQVFPYVFEFVDSQRFPGPYLLGASPDDTVLHAEDVSYVFSGKIVEQELSPNNTEAHDFSKKYVKMIVTFAGNGKPDGEILGSTKWPFTNLEQASQETPLKWFRMNNTGTSLENESFTERMTFWDNLFKKYK